ncbi:MAG: iron-sulfur cluster loop [Deltaproteobacteria bacterium]|nr:iron-sulfur cluster loop [Deltaproteobacteria bacterium]
MANRDIIVNYLIQQGREPLHKPKADITFTDNVEANLALNDLNTYPHMFVLGFLMDRGIDSLRAWELPTRVKNAFGMSSHHFENFAELTRKQLDNVFVTLQLHRYPARMAGIFYSAIQTILKEFEGNASNLWSDSPRSATLVRRLLHFEGMGGKNARIMANILFRYYKIPLADTTYLDITPDKDVRRLFQRFGFIARNASEEELIYCAREMNPSYPGIFDHACWDLAERVCKRGTPKCRQCELNPFCPKYNT